MIEQTYPGQGKRVVIGETGWPSAGSPNNEAVPSLENQRRFYLEFLALADANNVDYFYFDAFDELWKIEEPGGVGYATKNGDSSCNQPTGSYPDSVCPKIEQVFTLSSAWQQYAISLFFIPRDYRRTVGGFGFYAGQDVTFYLDDMVYQFDKAWLQQVFLPTLQR